MRDIDLLEKLCGYETGDYATGEAKANAVNALATWTPMDLVSALQITHLNGALEVMKDLKKTALMSETDTLQERHRVLRRQQSGLSLHKEAIE